MVVCVIFLSLRASQDMGEEHKAFPHHKPIMCAMALASFQWYPSVCKLDASACKRMQACCHIMTHDNANFDDTQLMTPGFAASG